MDLELWQVLGIKLRENQCLPFMGYAEVLRWLLFSHVVQNTAPETQIWSNWKNHQHDQLRYVWRDYRKSSKTSFRGYSSLRSCTGEFSQELGIGTPWCWAWTHAKSWPKNGWLFGLSKCCQNICNFRNQRDGNLIYPAWCANKGVAFSVFLSPWKPQITQLQKCFSMVSSSQYRHENISNVDEWISKMIQTEQACSIPLFECGDSGFPEYLYVTWHLREKNQWSASFNHTGDTQPLGTLTQATEVFNALLSCSFRAIAYWICCMKKAWNYGSSGIPIIVISRNASRQQGLHNSGRQCSGVTSLNSYFIKKKLKLVEGQIEVLHSTVNRQDLVGPSAKSSSTNLVNPGDNRISPSSLPSTQHHCHFYHHC